MKVRIKGIPYSQSEATIENIEIGDLVLDTKDNCYGYINTKSANYVSIKYGCTVEIGIPISRIRKLIPMALETKTIDMKYLFVFLLFFTSFAVSAQSRIINLDSARKTPKTELQLTRDAEKTTMLAIYKGIQYPIYLTKKGKHFIIVRAMSSGNWYRRYIDIEEKQSLSPKI